MSVRDRVVEQLEQLRATGASISLDDFGTGYSSLSYLKRFPISMIKIDQSFTAEILADPVAASIVEAIVSMTRILGLRPMVEGVETREQVQMLKGLGCEVAQGYFFGRPMPAAAFAEVLRANAGRRGFAASA